MRLTSLSCQAALVILALTAVYTLVYSGLSGLLFSAAVGLLVMAFIEPFELVVALTVLFALLYTTVLKRFLLRLEPFQDSSEVIRQRVASLGQSSPLVSSFKKKGPTGVYSASVKMFNPMFLKKAHRLRVPPPMPLPFIK
jgi:membrane protein implicated in regulation of membrane protease activity